MGLPATLNISLDFSTGATFGIPFTLDDPADGLLDKGIKDIDALEFAELVIVTEQKHADRGTL